MVGSTASAIDRPTLVKKELNSLAIRDGSFSRILLDFILSIGEVLFLPVVSSLRMSQVFLFYFALRSILLR